MNARRHRTLTAAFVVLLALAHVPARAEHGRDDGAGEGLTAEQAAAVVKRTYDGRVVSVKQEGNNEQRSYKVRVLLDGGRVKTVQVDARGHVREAN